MNTENHSQTAAFIWSVADLLGGDFKQPQYGRVILPFTLLRRLECVLELTREQVLGMPTKHKHRERSLSVSDRRHGHLLGLTTDLGDFVRYADDR